MAQVKERGGAGEERKFPSFPSPSPHFHFLALVTCFISRAAKTENPVPRSFFAPKPNANACYAGYSQKIFNYGNFNFFFRQLLIDSCLLIDKIWRWPLFFLFLARFLAICVKNCSTVPKKKTILQFHCRHTIANSLCLTRQLVYRPPYPQQTSIFTDGRRGLYTGYKSVVNNDVELQSLWGAGCEPTSRNPYGPETQRRRLFLKTSFPGSSRTWGRGCKTINGAFQYY